MLLQEWYSGVAHVLCAFDDSNSPCFGCISMGKVIFGAYAKEVASAVISE